jgi:hypothetical protein
MKIERLYRAYTSGALMLVNALVLFLFLNLAAHIALSMHESLSKDSPVSEKYGVESLQQVYAGYDSDDVQELLHETWTRPYVYEPFTQFRESNYEGKYVNVDNNGFRNSKDQAAWPPPQEDINIFLFGGSTTFGYGVEDSQTIASHLQKNMRDRINGKVNVYNFGRGFYFSSQERILFESLLSSGYTPDLAIFIDGLNDFYHFDGNPLYTARLSRYVSGEAKKITLASKLPLIRLLNAIMESESDSNKVLVSESGNINYDDSHILKSVINRYLENKRIIKAVAADFDIKLLFVWQPVPTYNYDDSNHLFAGPDYQRHLFSRYGYPMMKNYINKAAYDDELLWAADLQKDIKKPLYVDQVHYTGEFSEEIANFISEHLANKYF